MECIYGQINFTSRGCFAQDTKTKDRTMANRQTDQPNQQTDISHHREVTLLIIQLYLSLQWISQSCWINPRKHFSTYMQSISIFERKFGQQMLNYGIRFSLKCEKHNFSGGRLCNLFHLVCLMWSSCNHISKLWSTSRVVCMHSNIKRCCSGIIRWYYHFCCCCGGSCWCYCCCLK